MGAQSDKEESVRENAKTAKVSMPGECEIVITRAFDAPRAIVFEAWTKPEHLAQWWDPTGRPLAICEIDLRPNGAFRFVNGGPEGMNHPFTGTYREVAAPTRLVFATRSPSGGETVGTLVFSEQDGRTMFTLTMTCPSKADRDSLLKMQVDVGTTRPLDTLDKYLGRKRR